MFRSQWSGGRMAAFVLAAFIGSVPCATAGIEQRQQASRNFDRTVTVTSGQTLRVEHRHGDVRITTHARSDLRVQATIRVSADSQQEAAAFIDRIQIEMSETPTAVTVRTRYPQDDMRRDRSVSFAVDYTVLMPERMPLDLRNSFGNVSAAGIKADVAIVNAHGELTVADGLGSSRLENSFGPIEAARLAGDVTIAGANGAVSAATIGGALNVTNRFGRVAATAVSGAAVIANSNGEVTVTDALSARVTNSFGAVNVREVRQNVAVTNSNGGVTGGNCGPSTVTTSFGAVDLKDIAGDITVTNSNGAVKLAGVRGGATVKTSFASVDLTTVSGIVSVTNSNGAVSLRDIGGAVDVSGSFGAIDIQAVKAGVRINTANGNVRVADVDGAGFVKTSFGLVTAERLRGGLTVENSNGGVQASAIGAGVDVKTTFGPVVLRDVVGKITVRNQNGAIEAAVGTAKPGACQDVTLATSFSPIQVQLPDGGYTVAATTSFGKIHSDVPITYRGTLGEGSVSGTIGAGGCALHLTNANGDIRILKRPVGK
jgi:hypothetical protein